MAFRFQKRIKLLPGVTLNLSKKGISTSLGVKGARVTYGHGKKRTTVGLPGTGISHTSISSSEANRPKEIKASARPSAPLSRNEIAVAILAFFLFIIYFLT